MCHRPHQHTHRCYLQCTVYPPTVRVTHQTLEQNTDSSPQISHAPVSLGSVGPVVTCPWVIRFKAQVGYYQYSVLRSGGAPVGPVGPVECLVTLQLSCWAGVYTYATGPTSAPTGAIYNV